MGRTIAGAAVLVALFATLAVGQDREPTAIRFARALADRKWYDLAEAVLDDLTKDSSTPKKVLEAAEFLKADMRVDAATAEPDAAKRTEKIEAAVRFFEQYARAHPDSPMAADAKLRIGEISLQAGDAAMARVRAGGAGVDPVAERAEANTRYTAATAYFEQVVSSTVLPEPNEETGEIDGEAVYRLAFANFLWAKSIYKHATAFENGPEKEALLTQAAEAFQRVNFDFSDQLPGYESLIFLGLTEKERGHIDEAISAYESAAGLFEVAYPDGLKRGAAMDPFTGDIVSRALYLKAQLQNENGAFPGALETARKFRALFADLIAANNRLALSMILEEAKAKAGAGDKNGAITLAQQVQTADANGPVGYQAGLLIADLRGGGIGTSSGSDLAVERTLGDAETLIDSGKVAQGLARMRQLIADLEVANEELQKSLPLVWYTMGRALFGLERFDEAFACYDRVGRVYRTSEYAPRALFYSANCAGRSKALGDNAFDQGRYTTALSTLSNGYPTDPSAQAAGFLLGNMKVGERKFVEAAAEYAKVTAAAGEFYDAALYQIGAAWFSEARSKVTANEAQAREAFAKALTSFQACVTWANGAAARGVDPASERAGTLRKLGAESYLRIAEIRLHNLMKDPAAALVAARAAETFLGENGPAERLGEARSFMIDAHLAANDLPMAEAALVKLVEVSPESRRTSTAERNVAAALDAAAQPLLTTDVPAAKGMLGRAADHYARWLEVAVKAEVTIPYMQAARAGERLYAIALLLNDLPATTVSYTEPPDLNALPAAERFAQAGLAYSIALLSAPANPPPAGLEVWMITVKLGECYGFVRRWDECARTITRAVESEHLIGADTRVDVRVAQAKQFLIYAYADAAQAAREGAGSDAARLEWAITANARIAAIAPQGRDLWWRCKYEQLRALFQKGDRAQADVGLRSLQRQFADFDGGQYGMKPKFEALARELGPNR